VWRADPTNPKTLTTSLYAGTPGPILFLLEMARSTGDATYLATARRAVDALVASIPTQTEPGLYEGLAGTGFALGEAYLVTMDDKDRTAALECVTRLQDKATDLLVAKATTDGRGMRWVQAETRVKPEVRVAQTGLMQGASGIGLWLLHFDDYVQKRRAAVITLPDNPFTY